VSQLEHPDCDSDARNERRHNAESVYSLGHPLFSLEGRHVLQQEAKSIR
jgi:hypothetical protein